MNSLMVLLNIGGQEILIILLIVLVLFGGRKIPELMKGLGKGVREYKKAMNSVEDDLNGNPEPDKQSGDGVRERIADKQ